MSKISAILTGNRLDMSYPLMKDIFDVCFMVLFIIFTIQVALHQEIGRQTRLPSIKPAEASISETTLISDPVLGGLYHN